MSRMIWRVFGRIVAKLIGPASPIYHRRPEVLAQRASKDARPRCNRGVALRGRCCATSGGRRQGRTAPHPIKRQISGRPAPASLPWTGPGICSASTAASIGPCSGEGQVGHPLRHAAALLLIGVISWLVGSRGPFSLDADDIFRSSIRHLSLVRTSASCCRSSWPRSPRCCGAAGAVDQRLHDRDRAAGGCWRSSSCLGLTTRSKTASRFYWMLPLSLAAGVVYLWGFIEMGFCAAPPATTSSVPIRWPRRKRSRAARLGGDQQRELEIVPPSASPPGGMLC